MEEKRKRQFFKRVSSFVITASLLLCAVPQMSVRAETNEEQQFRQLYMRLIENGDNSQQDISELNLYYSTCKNIADDVKNNEGYIPYQCYDSYNLFQVTGMSGSGGEAVLKQFYMSQTDSGFFERYAAVKKIIREVQENFDDKMTDLDKLIWIHEYIVANTVYQNTGETADHMGGPTLVEGKGVCEGYAAAMMILLKSENIECKTVAGNSHEWAAVKIDGEWYHVDPTWDDTQASRGTHYFLIRNDQEFTTTLSKLHTIASVGIGGGEPASTISTSTAYTDWYVHNVKGQMYYYDGYWYYVENGSIVKNNSKGTAYETAVSGTDLKIVSLEEGVLKYTNNGEPCQITLPKDDNGNDGENERNENTSNGQNTNEGQQGNENTSDGQNTDIDNHDNEDTSNGQDAGKEDNQQDSKQQDNEQDGSNAAVVKQSVTKITISGISKKIAVGKKIQLKATVLPKNAANPSVKWKSSNTKYATVSKTGKVTLKKAGIGKTVTITATAADGSGVKSTYKIKIMRHAVKGIIVKAPSKTLKAGKSMTLKTTIKTSGKSVNKTLEFSSSNTKYATVNKKGKVTAKKAGKGKTVTITVTSTDGTNKKAKVKIKIK